MTNCPICEEKNRDKNLFCINCGEELIPVSAAEASEMEPSAVSVSPPSAPNIVTAMPSVILTPNSAKASAISFPDMSERRASAESYSKTSGNIVSSMPFPDVEEKEEAQSSAPFESSPPEDDAMPFPRDVEEADSTSASVAASQAAGVPFPDDLNEGEPVQESMDMPIDGVAPFPDDLDEGGGLPDRAQTNETGIPFPDDPIDAMTASEPGDEGAIATPGGEAPFPDDDAVAEAAIDTKDETVETDYRTPAPFPDDLNPPETGAPSSVGDGLSPFPDDTPGEDETQDTVSPITDAPFSAPIVEAVSDAGGNNGPAAAPVPSRADDLQLPDLDEIALGHGEDTIGNSRKAPIVKPKSSVATLPAPAQWQGKECEMCGFLNELEAVYCGECGTAFNKPTGYYGVEAGAKSFKLVQLAFDGSQTAAFDVDAQNGAAIDATTGTIVSVGQYDRATHARIRHGGHALTLIPPYGEKGVFARIPAKKGVEIRSGSVFRLGSQTLQFAGGTRQPGAWGTLRTLPPTTPAAVFSLDREEMIIGREAGHILFSHDPLISGRHMKIYSSNGGVFLYDLASTNGTLLKIDEEFQAVEGQIFIVGPKIYRVS